MDTFFIEKMINFALTNKQIINMNFEFYMYIELYIIFLKCIT